MHGVERIKLVKLANFVKRPRFPDITHFRRLYDSSGSCVSVCYILQICTEASCRRAAF